MASENKGVGSRAMDSETMFLECKGEGLTCQASTTQKKSKTKVQSSSLFSCGSLTFHRI
jgi:hypothetical protein